MLVDTDCSVKCAGGWLVQLMPGVKDSDIDKLEANLAKLESMTAMLDKGMSLEDIIRAVLDGFEVDFLQTSEIGYRCACSREKSSVRSSAWAGPNFARWRKNRKIVR